jgi:hypothetical protein
VITEDPEVALAKDVVERWFCSPRGRLAIIYAAYRYLTIPLTRRAFMSAWAEKFNMENVPGV